MSHIEEQLKGNFEEKLEEIRTNRSNNLITDKEDNENNRRGPFNSENKPLRRNSESNTEIDKDAHCRLQKGTN